MDFEPEKFDFTNDFNNQDADDSESNSDAEESSSSKENKRKKPQKKVNTKKAKIDIGAEENSSSKKSKKKKDLKKPPTAQELNHLKETESLYNNNLFKLQISELISEVKIKNKRIYQRKTWTAKFKYNIQNLPEYNDILLSEIKRSNIKKVTKEEKLIHKLAVNYNCPYETDQDLTFKFIRPESTEFFGLNENNCLPGPHLRSHINIKMPKTCFHNKDFLNNRYLVKKFYYMLYICENIVAYKKSIVYHENNVLLPILEVQPTEDEKLLVYIHVTPADDVFKATRFLPNLNNMKHDLFQSNIGDIEVLKDTPTILYNTTLAYDVTLSSNSKFVKDILQSQENIHEGIKLLLIWLKQRELHVGFGAFTENLVLYFIVYLLNKKKINNFMSSYQIIRIFWNFLSTEELLKNPISLLESSTEVLESFKSKFDLVLLDTTACFNLMAFVDVEIYKKVKSECELALKHLDEEGIESFKYLFLTKLPFSLQYDLIIDLGESLPIEDKFKITDSEKSSNIGYNQVSQLNHISKLLKRGLNKRIQNLVPKIELSFQKGQKYPIKTFMLGINLNPDEAFNFIEMGPALNDHINANDFRKFWGRLSSDRRFRDGSAHVAVYFKTNTIKGKRGIIKKIIRFLFTEKVPLKYILHYDEFEDVLICKKVVSPYPIGTNEESCLKVITASDELNKKIRNIQMSLGIMGMQGMSDSLNYTEVFPPISTIYKVGGITSLRGNNMIFDDSKKIGMIHKLVQTIDFVIQMEQSGKWPSTLEGMKSIKAAFYLEISKNLEEGENIVTSVSLDCLEVFYEGFVFRYRIYVPKELGLIKRELLDEEQASKECLKLEMNYSVLPKVNAALKGLQLQHPSFGPGTALIKRWLRSQLLDDFHVPDVVINLLNASLYMNQTGFNESNTPQISFLRFLKFVSELEWNLQPVIVNFNEEMPKEEIADIETNFQEHRNQLQPLYIVIPYDNGKSVFTKSNPTNQVLHRVQELSKAALELILTRVSDRNLFDLQQLFVPNWEGYEVLIHLRPLMNPKRHECVVIEGDSKVILEKYKYDKDEKIPIVNFDPVQIYLDLLRQNYGAFASFFHDTYGGNSIGVLWNPDTKKDKDFKVENMPARKKVEEKLVFNFEVVIDDFYLLGKDLVKWIEQR